MKSVVTLVLTLLCTLVGGFGNLHASDGHFAFPSSYKQHIHKTSHTQTFSSTNLCINNAANGTEQVDYLVGIEEEDQDEINKHVSAARFFLAFYYAFASKDRYSLVSDSPSFYKPEYFPGSGKYITQRVLRI